MNRRNSTEIWVWLRREGMRLVDVQRELGFRSHKTVWATIEGRENNRRVLSWLQAKGCPGRYLALPDDMRCVA